MTNEFNELSVKVTKSFTFIGYKHCKKKILEWRMRFGSGSLDKHPSSASKCCKNFVRAMIKMSTISFNSNISSSFLFFGEKMRALEQLSQVECSLFSFHFLPFPLTITSTFKLSMCTFCFPNKSTKKIHLVTFIRHAPHLNKKNEVNNSENVLKGDGF